MNTVTNVYPDTGMYTLEGFRPATEYNCSVFASNRAGDGPPASTTVTTLDDSELAVSKLKNQFSCCLLNSLPIPASAHWIGQVSSVGGK